MKTKAIYALWLMAFALSSVASHAADSVGLADSRGRFEITRQSKDVTCYPGSLTAVQVGDAIATQLDDVKLMTKAGDAVIVRPHTTATMVESGKLELAQGQVFVGLSGRSDLSVHADGLEIAALSTASTPFQDRVALINRVDADTLIVGGVDSGTSIKVQAAGAPLAEIRGSEWREFSRTENGWTLAQAEAAPADAPAAAGNKIKIYGRVIDATTLIPLAKAEVVIAKVAGGVKLTDDADEGDIVNPDKAYDRAFDQNIVFAKTSTDSKGYYEIEIEDLPAGDYDIFASMKGFRSLNNWEHTHERITIRAEKEFPVYLELQSAAYFESADSEGGVGSTSTRRGAVFFWVLGGAAVVGGTTVAVVEATDDDDDDDDDDDGEGGGFQPYF